MGSGKSVENLRRLTPFIGIMVAISLGIINSVYSDRFPHGSGLPLLIEFIRVGLSNPYALLDGVLASAFFWRVTLIPNRDEDQKTDFLMIALAFFTVVLSYLLQSGILVY